MSAEIVVVTEAPKVVQVIAPGPIGPSGASASPGYALTESPAGTFNVDPEVLHLNDGVFAVNDFGATGDGTTNDTTAIVAAFAAAAAAGGGTVLFGVGTYKITAAIEIPPFTTVRGTNTVSTIVKQATAGQHGFTCAGVDLGGGPVTQVSISDLTLEGIGATSTGRGISFLGQWYTRLERVMVKSFNVGIWLDLPLVSKINNCVAQNNNSHGFQIANGFTSTTFTSCFALANGGDGWHIDGGALGNYSAFISCASDNNLASNWYFIDCFSLVLTNCGSEYTSGSPSPGYGYHFEDCGQPTITGCYAFQTPGTSFLFTDCTRVLVQSCLATTPTALGFHFAGFSYGTAIQNRTDGGTGDNWNGKVARIEGGDPDTFDSPTVHFGDDVKMFRYSADVLKVNDALRVGGTLVLEAGQTLAAGQTIVWAGDTNLYRSSADNLQTDDSLAVGGTLYSIGNLRVNTAGSGIYIKEGSNATMGTLTLNGATTVTVSTTKVTASSRIFLTHQAPGGTVGGPAYVFTRSAGVSFGVRGTASDTSTVAWMIVEPA